jgi:hypothetical protein
MFSSPGRLKQLGVIIDRLTYIGTCELLLQPHEVSLKTPLEACGLDPSIIGALLERQVDSLEGSLWKEGVQNMVRSLLGDVVGVYSAAGPAVDMPLRRARVLIRSLEFGYKAGGCVGGSVRHPDDIGEESGELLGRDVEIFPSASRAAYVLILIVFTGSWSRFRFIPILSSISRNVTFMARPACSPTTRRAAGVTCRTSFGAGL